MSATSYLRGIIHCHSRYSHDSLVSISAYLGFARQYDLDFIMLTDHDTIAGSRDLKAAARRVLPKLEVPIAAEYTTSHGDVIAAFIDSDIKSRDIDAFVAEARERDALLLLPHPYVGHDLPEYIASKCDLIEVVNSRASDSANRKAAELASSLGMRSYVASDAHFARSLANAIVELEDKGSLKESLRHGKIRWAMPRLTGQWEYGASQLISACKLRDARKFKTLVHRTFKRLRKRVAPSGR